MSDEVYSIWRDEMAPLYFGALGGEKGVLDAKGMVKVPDGLWTIFGKINLNNETASHMAVDVRLVATVESFDRSLVRLGPNGSNDLASVSLQLVHFFPGTSTERVNSISIGVWNHYEKPSETPNVLAGRLKIIAMRVNHFISEPYPS